MLLMDFESVSILHIELFKDYVSLGVLRGMAMVEMTDGRRSDKSEKVLTVSGLSVA